MPPHPAGGWHQPSLGSHTGGYEEADTPKFSGSILNILLDKVAVLFPSILGILPRIDSVIVSLRGCS